MRMKSNRSTMDWMEYSIKTCRITQQRSCVYADCHPSNRFHEKRRKCLHNFSSRSCRKKTGKFSNQQAKACLVSDLVGDIVFILSTHRWDHVDLYYFNQYLTLIQDAMLKSKMQSLFWKFCETLVACIHSRVETSNYSWIAIGCKSHEYDAVSIVSHGFYWSVNLNHWKALFMSTKLLKHMSLSFWVKKFCLLASSNRSTTHSLFDSLTDWSEHETKSQIAIAFFKK